MPPTHVKNLVNYSINGCPYSLDILDGKFGPYLSISGSKKGGSYQGGGIPIQGLHFLNELCKLIDQIILLD